MIVVSGVVIYCSNKEGGVVMQQYRTLYAATDFAATTLCAGWRFATSNEKYDRSSLLATAEIHDDENPSDKDSFYVVSPNGAGFCEDGEEMKYLNLLLLISSKKADTALTHEKSAPNLWNWVMPLANGAHYD